MFDDNVVVRSVMRLRLHVHDDVVPAELSPGGTHCVGSRKGDTNKLVCTKLILGGERSSELEMKASVGCFFGTRQQRLQNAVRCLACDRTKACTLSGEKANLVQRHQSEETAASAGEEGVHKILFCGNELRRRKQKHRRGRCGFEERYQRDDLLEEGGAHRCLVVHVEGNDGAVLLRAGRETCDLVGRQNQKRVHHQVDAAKEEPSSQNDQRLAGPRGLNKAKFLLLRVGLEETKERSTLHCGQRLARHVADTTVEIFLQIVSGQDERRLGLRLSLDRRTPHRIARASGKGSLAGDDSHGGAGRGRGGATTRPGRICVGRVD